MVGGPQGRAAERNPDPWCKGAAIGARLMYIAAIRRLTHTRQGTGAARLGGLQISLPYDISRPYDISPPYDVTRTNVARTGL